MREKMGESFCRHDHQLQQQQHPPPTSAAGSTCQAGSSRLGLRNAGGEIVEVQGGHIVRSTGRKDRHSKVCTSKGPRDRRVRLSAHTAIQFYDVQDRLGYDRPSKAVDWLIKKAKSAIDELADLPAWHPTTTTDSVSNTSFEQSQKNQAENHQNPLQNQYNLQHLCIDHSHDVAVAAISGPSGKRAMSMLGNESDLHQSDDAANQSGNSWSFLPPLDSSDSIADTIKSFFPKGDISAEASSSGMQFQSFPPPDLLSRTSSHSQDLRLSLQPFQDPILLLHHHHEGQQNHHHLADHTAEQARVQQQAQTLFSGAYQLGVDASSGWSEHQQPSEIGRFQRMSGWNPSGDAAGGGYLFNSPATPQPPFMQQLFGGHNHQLFSQRGPLQSSNTPSVRAWMDPSAISIATADPSIQHHHHHQAVLPIYPSSISGIGFASGVCGISGFRIPARIQGEEEEHDGISKKPSSAFSDSRH